MLSKLLGNQKVCKRQNQKSLVNINVEIGWSGCLKYYHNEIEEIAVKAVKSIFLNGRNALGVQLRNAVRVVQLDIKRLILGQKISQ